MDHDTTPRLSRTASTEDLLLAFQRLIPALVLLNERAAGALGLLSVDMQVLHLLALGKEPATPGELAAASELPASTLARVLARLDARGLVRRMPNPADGRSAKIRPTARMRRVRDHFTPYARAVSALASDFDVSEQDAIRRFLHGLVDITR